VATCARCGTELPDGARFCPACGAPAAAASESVDERKLATVLFADLVGSTALGASQDPERTRATLDRFYDAMAREIEAAGGTVEKFAGDAVMAAFGAPAALEDHAERALHAALAMQRRLRALFGEELALRIGVNTGDVVVGRPREGSSFVTGDAVNVAARLEQAAAPGEILVGVRTAALAAGAFELGDGRIVEAKGKEGGVEAQPLLRALSLTRPRGVGGLHRAFVGRDTELDLLLANYARAVRQGDPHLVTITADAGVGAARPRAVAAAHNGVAGAAAPHRPVPRVRPGHHLLAARRDPQGASRHPRERFARSRAQAAGAERDPRARARARRRR